MIYTSCKNSENSVKNDKCVSLKKTIGIPDSINQQIVNKKLNDSFEIFFGNKLQREETVWKIDWNAGWEF